MRLPARSTVSAWPGLALLLFGEIVYAVAYFRLPFISSVLECLDTCSAPPIHTTAWENASHVLTIFASDPIVGGIALVFYILPLIGAVVLAGYGIAYAARARRALARWGTVILITGTVVLVLPLISLLVVQVWQPQLGYLGMLLAYGFFWLGSRLLFATHPQR